ncbi:hypothetical protein ACODT5_01360 [Streptomyces sp. 5.8]|uniref:hypothetical protein n=1 Tax=Streptomyces sp. 5.8 TaxID=3406571 RepID=UPI003BB6FD31
MPTTRLPTELRAPWQTLPRRAALAHRLLGPPALHWFTRPAAWGLWLLALSVIRADGRVLAHRTATLTVSGPRTAWPRRLAVVGVGALSVVLASVVMVLPAAVAVLVFGPMPAWLLYPVLLAPVAVLVAEMLRMLWSARSAMPTAKALRALRADGSRWWEAATFVVDEEDPMSAGRLVLAALAYVDAHQIGLVAVPMNQRVRRAYERRGFVPWPGAPRILYRTPAT